MDIQRGIVSNWNERKGFGFITSEKGGKPLFFHIKDYSYHHKLPVKNLTFQYYIFCDQKGRICAAERRR